MKFLSLFTNVELLYYESCLESQIGGVQVIWQAYIHFLTESQGCFTKNLPGTQFCFFFKTASVQDKGHTYHLFSTVMERNTSKHTLEDIILGLQSPQEIVMPHFPVNMLEVKWQPGVLPPTNVSDISWMAQLRSVVKHLLTYQQSKEVKQKEYKGANLIAPESFTHTLKEPSLERLDRPRNQGPSNHLCLLKATHR